MANVLVCFSGGLDSTTLVALLKKEGNDITALFIDRGQTNVDREYAAAKHFAEVLSVPLAVTSLRDWRASWRKPDGVSDKEIPRNAMFVLAAIPFALESRAQQIALGTNVDDAAMPDGSKKFIRTMDELLDVTGLPISVVAPFLDREMNKIAVAKHALGLLGKEGVARTWSCWTGKEKPCGDCPPCRTRQYALEKAAGA